MGLDGTISPVLGNLSSLRYLVLAGNYLTGTIPSQLGQLRNLWMLRLDNNQLQGTVPPGLSACRSLYYLALSYNQLHGSIPPELSLLKSLKYLYIGANSLTEYGLGGSVSTKGDVYSYGILILEMVTRKRPNDDMFVGDLNLQKWVRLAFPDRLTDIIDSELLNEVNENMEDDRCLLSFIHIGLLCTAESPSERPSIRDVAKTLGSLKPSSMGGAASSMLTATISELLKTNPTGTLAPDSQSSTF
ncbi:hypothetical protein SUGI_1475530 [Cryptomeria japonica]|uniref:Uncharacterized protein n=1 Tax=Cryptomeria japonica TaxID=3369 RepID=A0AAD3NTZ6_CRYJA|nr:hypothetical protein SUGI_0569130 [Cryptomeria japonica]GLJ58770.1 hypothetical protein SUGI_1475530 [Cryptomeria japonica]